MGVDILFNEFALHMAYKILPPKVCSRTPFYAHLHPRNKCSNFKQYFFSCFSTYQQPCHHKFLQVQHSLGLPSIFKQLSCPPQQVTSRPVKPNHLQEESPHTPGQGLTMLRPDECLHFILMQEAHMVRVIAYCQFGLTHCLNLLVLLLQVCLGTEQAG